jgi:putative redox protein
MGAIERERPAAGSGSSSESEDGWVSAATGAGTYRTEVTVRGHTLVADEPKGVGGGDVGPTPYDFLLASLGACTSMTLRMYASRKGWPLEEAVVRLRNARSHAADCENCETQTVGIRRLERQIELKGALSDEQRERLLAIADRCPVKQTLERAFKIENG